MTSRRALTGDIALAAALIIIGVVGTTAAAGDITTEIADRPLDAAGYALVIGAGALLVVRRPWPRATLLAVAVLTATYLAVGYAFGPILFSFFVAVYTAARHRAIRQSGPVALAALGLLLTHLVTNDASLPGLWGAVPASAWVVVPFSIGVAIRVSREATERERAELVRQRVDRERLRVAHEVHDIVGHGLAAIRMQADVALHVLDRKPDQAQAALEAISRTSGEALDELRVTLGGLRDRDIASERSPEPRLGQLEALQQRMMNAGARVHLEVSGKPRLLPPAVDLAGYRIVQESLTNVLRHSASKAADVHVDYQAAAVEITVSNAAPDTPTQEHGLGIAGMRKRVESLGGEFSAGPTPDQRFEVRAMLPAKEPQ